MALYNIPIGFKIFAIINLHQRNETFTRSRFIVLTFAFIIITSYYTLTRFRGFHKLPIVSPRLINFNFKGMLTRVSKHKYTIHLTISEGI